MSSPSSLPIPVHQQQQGNPKGVPYFPEKSHCGLPLSGSVGGSSNMCNGSMPPKDDGSSGYGSPDSEIVDASHAQ